MQLPGIDKPYLLQTLVELLNTPTPTGFTEAGVNLLETELIKFSNIKLSHTNKGSLVGQLKGKCNENPRALTAHLDTLGAMVKEIKESGRLKMSQVGGYDWNSVEGEGCTIHTSTGKRFRGTILIDKASVHVHGKEAFKAKRTDDTMEVRIDDETSSAETTRLLGIDVGDFISFDPRVEVVNNFIKSRHLDDKACVAVILAALKSLFDAQRLPEQDTAILFSVYEEVGHGAASGVPSSVNELLAIDMAAVGEGQNSDECHATICAKDSGGPYHYGFSQKLRQLAEKFNIPYNVDIYPHYGSDGESYWRAGGDVAVALIGPGIDASHGYERTHVDALVDTTRWVLAYLLN